MSTAARVFVPIIGAFLALAFAYGTKRISRTEAKAGWVAIASAGVVGFTVAAMHGFSD